MSSDDPFHLGRHHDEALGSGWDDLTFRAPTPEDYRRWRIPEPLWTGDALSNLHADEGANAGTRWTRFGPRHEWVPDCCDRHRPQALQAERAEAAKAETKRRRDAEKALARQRRKPYHEPEEEAVTVAEPAPEEPEPVDTFTDRWGRRREKVPDEEGERLFARWLALIHGRRDTREPWEK